MMVRKVLFVDDDQILCSAIEKRLEAFSDTFTLTTAVDGFEAVRKLQEISFSIIVLDLIMPRMDGMSLIGHIQEKYPDLPIIIISSTDIVKMKELAEACGAAAYLSKPFGADALVATINSILRKEADGGTMYDVSPTIFLQFMEMDAKTCTIRIFDKVTQKGGVLYFIDGQLVDARIGEEKGIDAACTAFTWDIITMFIHNECAPRKNRINSDLQPIIMKAVGMKDESDDQIEDGDNEDPPEAFFSPGNDLDDPDLPDSFLISPALHEVASEKNNEAHPEQLTDGYLADIERLLRQEAGETCGLVAVTCDETMAPIIEKLTRLGALTGADAFEVGYIDNGKEFDRILLPGQPATVVKVRQNCPQDKLLQVLRSVGKSR
jgi:CheY-like chemotaxis protein